MKPGGTIPRLNLTGSIGVICSTIIAITAVTGLFYTPYDPVVPDFSALLAPPSETHWFGTDQFGRDVFSRILSGAVVSLWVALCSVSLALLWGTLLGAVSGYFGAALDRIFTLIMNALLAMPGILLALGIMAAIGPSIAGLIIALGIAYTPTVFRVVRSVTLTIREKEYVEASRAQGNGELYTLFRHVVPNCLSPIIVLGAALCASAILAEAALSFLGLGVPPPDPSWGGMLAESRTHIVKAPWLAILPGIAITIALLGINLCGDLLRDKLDPRMRGV